MSLLSDKIAALQADVTKETEVTTSAIALLTGIPALIQTAVAQAIADGADPATLAALDDLKTQIESSTTDLAAAVTANTPGGPVVEPAPAPEPLAGGETGTTDAPAAAEGAEA